MRRLCLFAVLFAMPLLSLASDTGRKDSYVLRDGDVTYMLGEGMSAGALKKLQERYGPVFLWARREGRTYLFRDETTLDAARAVVSGNVSVRAEQEKRMAAVVDTAIRSRRGLVARAPAGGSPAVLQRCMCIRIQPTSTSAITSSTTMTTMFWRDVPLELTCSYTTFLET
jgi:hypothetical protein